MKFMQTADGFFMDPRHDECYIVLLTSFCQLAKNTLHKFNPETYLIGDWPSVMSFDDLCVESSPESLPVAIYLANHLSLISK
jgi:hypothetical protein